MRCNHQEFCRKPIPGTYRYAAATVLMLVAMQAFSSEPASPPGTAYATGTVEAGAMAKTPGDQALQARVAQALHTDPYFYDRHVTVVVQDGKVTLHGFVFSDWDLRNAIRIATEASQGHPVIDALSIKEGGRR